LQNKTRRGVNLPATFDRHNEGKIIDLGGESQMSIDSQTQMEMLERAIQAAGFGGASAGDETSAPVIAASPPTLEETARLIPAP
jgi:hypothetical protein